MKSSETEQQENTETLEHLLGVVVENREKRCKEAREIARVQAGEIIKQAHTRSRARMKTHINSLREKYRFRVSAAQAHNQTRLRQQHQKADRAALDEAWPLLHEAMLALWKTPDSRQQWLDAAIVSASSILLQHDWHIEHPKDLSEEEHRKLKHDIAHHKGKVIKLVERDDIGAGIRISAHGTVIDATLEGLLKHKTAIEGRLIAQIKQGASSHD